jgi:hypothetical protein
MVEKIEMNYGLGMSNVTNLKKGERAVLSQKNAFTVIQTPKDSGSCAFNVKDSENVVITGFLTIFLDEDNFRTLLAIAKRLQRETIKRMTLKSYCEKLLTHLIVWIYLHGC